LTRIQQAKSRSPEHRTGFNHIALHLLMRAMSRGLSCDSSTIASSDVDSDKKLPFELQITPHLVTIAIYACPMAETNSPPKSRVRRTLQKALDYKRNPRSHAYMSALAGDIGDGKWSVIDDSDLTDQQISGASGIVLLWPDANGFGWEGITRRINRSKRPEARVHVLNGRRRYFELTLPFRLRFAIRRAIQRMWLGEIAFMTAGLVIAAPLAAWDKLNKRS
jgi:hypothetical protein